MATVYIGSSGAKVEKHDSGFVVTYFIDGLPEQRKAEADNLLHQYPPEGYRTKVLDNGERTTVVRDPNCD